MEQEEWKRIYIDDKETNYEISNMGRCRNTKKLNWKTGGILKPKFNPQNGYCDYTIVLEGKNYSKYAHRLVGEYFVKGFKKELQVNHEDGNKTHNVHTNLTWVTRKENMQHAFANDLVSTTKPIKQYNLKGEWIADFKSASEAGRIYGFDARSISAALTGENRSAYRFQWCFIENCESIGDISNETVQYGDGVVQLTLEGNYIREFDSITEAYRMLNKTDNGVISQVCKGKRRQHAGFKWMYKSHYYESMKSGTDEDIV